MDTYTRALVASSFQMSESTDKRLLVSLSILKKKKINKEEEELKQGN